MLVTPERRIRVAYGVAVVRTLDSEIEPAVARDQYRLFSVYSWISATTTYAMGSKWQPAEVGRIATERTTQALIDLDVLALLDERLG